MDNSLLYNKLTDLPDNLRKEVEDFIDFLIHKSPSGKSPVRKPKFGSGKNMIVIKPGFDEPLEDFREYM